ncbi:hypothetical protein L596_008046 [Steinernema carpocapsae]|uniref:UBA domain-containing protein n=1 Tax=Steinernema carpocapsae TaxID=34508 RepID=A0A4U5PBK0_STECR|nr:hypothetical protein L596_008046 [Steinernema carpocapsae]
MVLVHLSGRLLRTDLKRERDFPIETPIANVIADFIQPEADRENFRVVYREKYYDSEGTLAEIPNLKPHHSVKVIRKRRALQAEKLHPALNVKCEKLRWCQKILKKMEHYLVSVTSDKNYIPNLLKEYPVLKNEPYTLSVLCDRQLILSTFANETTLREVHPVIVDIIHEHGMKYAHHRDQNPALIRDSGHDDYQDYQNMQPMRPVQPPFDPSMLVHPNQRQGQNQQGGAGGITMEMLQSAIFQSLRPGGEGSSSEASASISAPAPQQAPAPDFSVQLAQMRDFGFTDEQENIEALIVTEGNVEMALEMVISNREMA